MRESERGFTLIEIIVVVAITAVLLAAGGMLLGGMHPGALRAAVDDFDADVGAAKAIAATSGNGATIAVLPRYDERGGIRGGFELRVYSGRPTAANAVAPSNVMSITSDAAIMEKTFGKPPFALFLSSAGHPSGISAYPVADAHGVITFNVVASQPPCPAGGIVITFTSPQGATDTRTLQCNVSVSAAAIADPSPTPNAPIVTPRQLVAHWTSDSQALHFVAAEFGYTHWFASSTGVACGSSAAYDAGWPYSQPANAAESSLAPSPPNAPYSWPNASAATANDPPAAFAMSPVKGSPGLCSVDVVDDYGQHAGAAVQVMGDLTPSATRLSFASPSAPAQSLTLSKIWDSDNIVLRTATNCAAVATFTQSSATTPSAPSATPATVLLTVAPKGAGNCDIVISDQYGEPAVDVHITVASAEVQVWPPAVQYPVSGGTLSYAAPAIAPSFGAALNVLLGGGVAFAAFGPCPGINQPRGFSDNFVTPLAAGATDAADPNQTLVRVGANGCLVTSSGTPINAATMPSIVVSEQGYKPPGTFTLSSGSTCPNASLSDGGWNPVSGYGPTAGKIMSPGESSNGGCILKFADQSGNAPNPPAGSTANVKAEVVAASCKSGNAVCWTIVHGSGQRINHHCLAGQCWDTPIVWGADAWYQSTNGGYTWFASGTPCVYGVDSANAVYDSDCQDAGMEPYTGASPGTTWGPYTTTWAPPAGPDYICTVSGLVQAAGEHPASFYPSDYAWPPSAVTCFPGNPQF